MDQLDASRFPAHMSLLTDRLSHVSVRSTTQATPRSELSVLRRTTEQLIRRWTKPTPPTGTRRLRRPRFRSRGNRPNSLASTMEALITTAKSNPMVSTTMCRLRPDSLLPALLLRGSFSCGPHRLAKTPLGVASQQLGMGQYLLQFLSIGSPLTEILPDRAPRGKSWGIHPPPERGKLPQAPCSMGPSSTP